MRDESSAGALMRAANSIRTATVAVFLAALASIGPAAAKDATEQIKTILAKGDPAYGEYLSGQCVTCHHSKGKDKGIPSIIGLPDAYFVQLMLDYKHAREGRTNPAMVNVAKNLSEEEIGALAVHFSKLKAE